MAPLRAALVEEGFGDPASVLASGNLVLSTDLAASDVEATTSAIIRERFGVVTRCFALEREELDAMVGQNLLAGPERDPSRLVAIVLSEEPGPDAAPPPSKGATDALCAGRFVFQWCPDGISNAPALVPWIEQEWGLSATARNWRTVTRLRALAFG
jgi:uncharacterized protein (DUF1697 family)